MYLSTTQLERMDQEQVRAHLLFDALKKFSTSERYDDQLTPYDILRQTIDEAYECGYIHGSNDDETFEKILTK